MLFLAISTFAAVSSGLSLVDTRHQIPGIWKLFLDVDNLRLTSDSQDMARVRQKLTKKFELQFPTSIDKRQPTEILLRLNFDGTFRQCSEDYTEGCWMSGRWNVRYCHNLDDPSVNLLLALDRQYYGPRHDILSEGAVLPVSENARMLAPTSTTSHGLVSIGNFMYPKNHPCFLTAHWLILLFLETSRWFKLLHPRHYCRRLQRLHNRKTEVTLQDPITLLRLSIKHLISSIAHFT